MKNSKKGNAWVEEFRNFLRKEKFGSREAKLGDNLLIEKIWKKTIILYQLQLDQIWDFYNSIKASLDGGWILINTKKENIPLLRYYGTMYPEMKEFLKKNNFPQIVMKTGWFLDVKKQEAVHSFV